MHLLHLVLIEKMFYTQKSDKKNAIVCLNAQYMQCAS